MKMAKREYYNLKERIAITKSIWRKADGVREILEQYPDLCTMSLQDVKEWLMDRASTLEAETQREFVEQ